VERLGDQPLARPVGVGCVDEPHPELDRAPQDSTRLRFVLEPAGDAGARKAHGAELEPVRCPLLSAAVPQVPPSCGPSAAHLMVLCQLGIPAIENSQARMLTSSSTKANCNASRIRRTVRPLRCQSALIRNAKSRCIPARVAGGWRSM
jgi:hypothetical protein